jgi:hypothetical protein
VYLPFDRPYADDGLQTFGLAESVEHFMSREPSEFVDQEVFMDATLDLITIFFQ